LGKSALGAWCKAFPYLDAVQPHALPEMRVAELALTQSLPGSLQAVAAW